MKTCFVISPLRGTEEQFTAIDREVEKAVAYSWMHKDPSARATYIRLATLHHRRHLLESNVALCKRLCFDLALLGYAPWAPHLFYPLFLDDGDEFQRDLGMAMGRAWMARSEEAFVYRKAGLSSGMRGDIEAATGLGIMLTTPPAWMP